MTSLKSRLRSLLIALAVLALSAGVALAGRVTHSTQAPAVGAAAEGEQGEQGEQGDEAEAPETEAPEVEAPDAAETPETDTTTGVHPDNHGKLVSEAAQAVTPTGFDNHGAYVRTVAQANHGQEQAAAAKTKHTTKAPKN